MNYADFFKSLASTVQVSRIVVGPFRTFVATCIPAAAAWQGQEPKRFGCATIEVP